MGGDGGQERNGSGGGVRRRDKEVEGVHGRGGERRKGRRRWETEGWERGQARPTTYAGPLPFPQRDTNGDPGVHERSRRFSNPLSWVNLP